MKVNITQGPGFTAIEMVTTPAELLFIQASTGIISWGPTAYTDQKAVLEACIMLRKPVVVIATADDMPPPEELERFNTISDVIVYDEHLEGDKARAVEEAIAITEAYINAAKEHDPQR